MHIYDKIMYSFLSIKVYSIVLQIRLIWKIIYFKDVDYRYNKNNNNHWNKTNNNDNVPQFSYIYSALQVKYASDNV